MKRCLTGGLLLALTARAFAAVSVPANSTLAVLVQDAAGNPVAGAQVIALRFNSGTPDSFASRIAQTDQSGNAAFSGGSALVDGLSYQIVAAKQGFLPTIVDQLNFGTAPNVIANPSAAQSVTIGLGAAGAVPGVGEIDIGVVNASPLTPLLFGQVGLQGGGGAVAYGAAQLSGSSGAFQFFNVGPAGPNTYQISALDPSLNAAASAPVNQPLIAGGLINTLPPLDFSSAAPPVTTINQQQQSGQGGNLSLSGIVTDANNAPIPFIPLNFSAVYVDQYCQPHNDFRGAQTDQNGAFQLYGLVPGATYYTTALGGCNPNSGACYQGFQDVLPASICGVGTSGNLCTVSNPTVAARGGVKSHNPTTGPNGCGSPGPDDFLYPSTGGVLSLHIALSAAPPSTGTLSIQVTDQYGDPFPQVSLGLFPDGATWQTCIPPLAQAGQCGCSIASPYGATSSNPGLKQATLNNLATGYALITGLPSGNYSLSVFTPYGQTNFNAPNAAPANNSPAGVNSGQFYPGQCSAVPPGQTFYRLTIDTMTTPDMRVYDSSGNSVGAPSYSTTVVVNVGAGAGGLVAGTIAFPSAGVDLSKNPILITLSVNCSGGGACPSGASGGGFKVLNSPSNPQTVQYSIPVSSGYVYHMNIASSYWGAVLAGGTQLQPDLTRSNTAVVNLQFTPAGRVLGFLRSPDGSVFIPPQNQGTPVINANGNSSGGGTQINSDGSFVLGGLLPGAYTLNVQAGGLNNFPYATQQPAPTVAVAANQDVHQDVSLVSAVPVRPVVVLASLPPFTQLQCANNNGGGCPPESWTVAAYPAGTSFTTPVVDGLIANGNGAGFFQFIPSSGTANGNCIGNQVLTQPGFCATPLPSNPSGTSYDFYVTRLGAMDFADIDGGARPYFVIENSSKSVTIGLNFTNDVQFNPNFNPPTGSTTPVEDVALTPPASLAGVQQATLAGTVTVSNIINQRQFQQLGGNFSSFLSYLPLVWVYDSGGALKGGGLVVPFPPTERIFDARLNQAVTGDDFAQFQTLMTAAPPNGWGPMGFEIRGLTAGQTYALVATSPNYPPLKTSVTLGAIGSKTTLNLNFDANAGATMTGVVNSTNIVTSAIAGAQVTVQSFGYPATTVTTDNTGAWSLSGLPSGQYQLLVVAAGYALGAQIVDVAGGGKIAVPAFSLLVGNASIGGTVYTNNPICPPGAICSFGRTVLPGAEVVAYDDTLNEQSPSTVLPLYRAVTDSSGSYRLNGLVYTDNLTAIAHVHKVFVNVPGYYVVNQSTPTSSSPVTGFDFSLKPKPLDVDIFGYVAGPSYEFQITNYKSFSSGRAYIGPTTGFSTAAATEVTSSSVSKPDSQGNPELFLDYPLTSLTAGVSYTLEIVAQPNDPSAPPVVKVLPFGLDLPNGVCQAIDQALLGDSSVNAQGAMGNWALLDISGGNASGIAMPVGGVIPVVSTTVPSMCMSQSSATVSPAAAAAIRASELNIDAFLSGVYSVTLSSINYVKGVGLTLAYNQASTDINDAAIFTFDRASQRWLSVPGLQTIDPVRGTISVRGLQSLASVLDLKKGARMMALSTGRGYRPNAQAPRSEDTGLFAILRPSQVNAGAFSGTVLKIFNFPNPFNLQTKSVPLSASVGVCAGAIGPVVTDGTVIKYEIPAGVGGQGVIRIYTLSGRLVRELDAGVLAPDTCYYTTWDGKNRGGLPVADGVYYGILSVGGSKQTNGTFKLAVIK